MNYRLRFPRPLLAILFSLVFAAPALGVDRPNIPLDPGQRANLIEKHAEKAAELRALLATIREQGQSAPRFR